MARPRRTSNTSEAGSIADGPQELGSMYDYLAKVILLGPSGAGKSCLLHRFVKNEWRILSSQTIGVEFASKIIKIGTGARRKRIKLQLWDTAGTERFRSVSRSYYRGAAGAILVYDVASAASFAALPTFLMDARALASPNLTVILTGNKMDLATEEPQTSIGGIANGHVDIPSSKQPPQQYQQQGATASSTSSRQSFFPAATSIGDGATSITAPRSASNSISGGTGSKWTVSVATEGREISAQSASRWASQSNVPVAMEVSALSGDNVEELFHRLARMILTKIELGEIDPDDPQSGIQYGDAPGGTGAWSDGASVRSGVTLDDGAASLRRRTGKAKGGGGGFRSTAREWEDVFRLPGSTSRRGGGCC